jgi:serine/threonine protein kinase
MGNCTLQEPKDHQASVHLDHFKKIQVIGKGSFGKVWKVEQKGTGKVFAMKEMYKRLVINKNSVCSILNERSLLGMLRHPFIVNMNYAFQDSQGLYLVLDHFAGGDLRYYFKNHLFIPENSLKFLTACIIAGLEYLHSNSIIHRDIKPENLVFDTAGYIHLTDFGIARCSDMDNSGIVSGTPGYMSPEAICGLDHSCSSDYFSLGVMLFEISTGNRPYVGSTRKEVRENMLMKQAVMPQNKAWTLVFEDFVNRLVQRKPKYRLGSQGIHELKEHEWLKGVDWEGLYKKSLISPFKIVDEENFDKEHVSKDFPRSSRKLIEFSSQNIFAGYYFDQSITFLNK